MRTLGSVAAQSADPSEWECVVVNNNSTDSTADDFKTFAAGYPHLNIRMVDEPKQGLSNARNRGIASTTGDCVVIIDDDETVGPGFLANYIAFFEEYDAIACGGGVVACYDTARPKWMSRYPERMIANPMDYGRKVCLFPDNRVPAGGNMAFRREVFEIYGGFDPTLGRNGEQLTGGEENELFARLRYAGNRLYYVPDTEIYHHIPDSKLTLDYFRRLSFDVGRSKYLRAAIRGKESLALADERAKRLAALVIALFYVVTLRPAKAKYLLIMRRGISEGMDAQRFNRVKAQKRT